jgi:hypothetical protein
MHGPEGVRFYAKLKTITSRWPAGIRGRRVHHPDDAVRTGLSKGVAHRGSD